MAVNKYKHWQHLCKGNATWFKKVQQPSSVDKLLIFPHFPPFPPIFPHFPSFSPFSHFSNGLVDTGILRIWILPRPEMMVAVTGNIHCLSMRPALEE